MAILEYTLEGCLGHRQKERSWKVRMVFHGIKDSKSMHEHSTTSTWVLKGFNLSKTPKRRHLSSVVVLFFLFFGAWLFFMGIYLFLSFIATIVFHLLQAFFFIYCNFARVGLFNMTSS